MKKPVWHWWNSASPLPTPASVTIFVVSRVGRLLYCVLNQIDEYKQRFSSSPGAGNKLRSAISVTCGRSAMDGDGCSVVEVRQRLFVSVDGSSEVCPHLFSWRGGGLRISHVPHNVPTRRVKCRVHNGKLVRKTLKILASLRYHWL